MHATTMRSVVPMAPCYHAATARNRPSAGPVPPAACLPVPRLRVRTEFVLHPTPPPHWRARRQWHDARGEVPVPPAHPPPVSAGNHFPGRWCISSSHTLPHGTPEARRAGKPASRATPPARTDPPRAKTPNRELKPRGAKEQPRGLNAQPRTPKAQPRGPEHERHAPSAKPRGPSHEPRAPPAKPRSPKEKPRAPKDEPRPATLPRRPAPLPPPAAPPQPPPVKEHPRTAQAEPCPPHAKPPGPGSRSRPSAVDALLSERGFRAACPLVPRRCSPRGAQAAPLGLSPPPRPATPVPPALYEARTPVGVEQLCGSCHSSGIAPHRRSFPCNALPKR